MARMTKEEKAARAEVKRLALKKEAIREIQKLTRSLMGYSTDIRYLMDGEEKKPSSGRGAFRETKTRVKHMRSDLKKIEKYSKLL